MTFDKALPLIGLGVLYFAQSSFALGQTQYVETIPGQGSFPIVRQRVAATVFVDSNDFTGVLRATGDLQADIARVTSVAPAITHAEKNSPQMQSSSERSTKVKSLTG